MIIRIVCLILFGFVGQLAAKSEPVEFAIVIPSYNNAQWCLGNLESCLCQTYSNYKVYYINDASTDSTRSLVELFITSHGLRGKYTLISNTERRGSLANMYDVISKLPGNVVVVCLDGDDKLAHKRVLAKLAKVYHHDKKIWLTYGNYEGVPFVGRSRAAEFPADIIRNREFRSYPWYASHLKTFYAKLFQNIKKEDFFWNGKFFPASTDMVMMFPMLEMASRGHFKFIKEILYIYNTANPIGVARDRLALQLEVETELRTRPAYRAYNQLF